MTSYVNLLAHSRGCRIHILEDPQPIRIQQEEIRILTFQILRSRCDPDPSVCNYTWYILTNISKNINIEFESNQQYQIWFRSGSASSNETGPRSEKKQ